MLRKLILACLLVGTASTAYAAGADDPSTDDAPFAGNKSSSPAPFAASPSAGFGAMGQWVLSMRTTSDSAFVFFHKPSGGDWTLSLHPSIDYFLTSSISLGATFGYTYSPAATGTTVLDLGGRAGFNLTINDHIGFWPMAGVGVNVNSSDHNTNTAAAFSIFAPFLYHLVPHLFAGVGPSFSVQLNDGNGKVYGLDFILGGWL